MSALAEWPPIRPVHHAIKSINITELSVCRSVFTAFPIPPLRVSTNRWQGRQRWKEKTWTTFIRLLCYRIASFLLYLRVTHWCCEFKFPSQTFSKILITISAAQHEQLCQHERALREMKSGCSECYPGDLTQIPPSPPCNNKGMLC